MSYQLQCKYGFELVPRQSVPAKENDIFVCNIPISKTEFFHVYKNV